MNPDNRLPQRLALLSVILLALAALAFAAPALVTLFPARPPAPRTATVISTPAPTPAPTPTPEATIPALQPVAVAPATVAPVLAAAPAAAKPLPLPVSASPLTAEERTYALALTEQLDAYAVATTRLAERFAEVEQTPAVADTDAWKLEVGMSLGILQETGRRVRALAPPPRFHGVHDTLVAMSLEWDSAAANMIRGFDAQDADAFVLGIQDFFTGIVLMSQAQADFEELVR